MNQDNPEYPSPDQPPGSIPVARPASGPLWYARTASSGPFREWWAPVPMTRLQALGDLLVVGGLLLVPHIVAGLLGVQWDDRDLESIPPAKILIANALQMGMVAAVAVYLTYRSGQPLSSIGFGRTRFWPTIGTALAATFAMYVTLIIMAVLAAAITRPSYQTMTQPMREITGRLGLPSWGMIFLLAASAGIFEEILFRGFLLTRLRVLLGNWTAAIALGVFVFALPHAWQGWWAVMLILPVALVLSITFVLRRSLAAPMLAHFLFNFVQLGLLRALYNSPYLQQFMQQQ